MCDVEHGRSRIIEQDCRQRTETGLIGATMCTAARFRSKKDAEWKEKTLGLRAATQRRKAHRYAANGYILPFETEFSQVRRI